MDPYLEDIFWEGYEAASNSLLLFPDGEREECPYDSCLEAASFVLWNEGYDAALEEL